MTNEICRNCETGQGTILIENYKTPLPANQRLKGIVGVEGAELDNYYLCDDCYFLSSRLQDMEKRVVLEIKAGLEPVTAATQFIEYSKKEGWRLVRTIEEQAARFAKMSGRQD